MNILTGALFSLELQNLRFTNSSRFISTHMVSALLQSSNDNNACIGRLFGRKESRVL